MKQQIQNLNEPCCLSTAQPWIKQARQIFPLLSGMLEDMECPRSFVAWGKTLPSPKISQYVHSLWKKAGRPDIEWPHHSEMDCNGLVVAILSVSLGDISLANVRDHRCLLVAGLMPTDRREEA